MMAEKMNKRMFINKNINLFNKAEKGYYIYPPSAFNYIEEHTKQLHKLKILNKYKLDKDIST